MPVINKSSNYKRFLLSLGISVLICVLCLILSCVAAYATDDPTSNAKPFSLIALFTSSFISGIVSIRINGGNLFFSLYNGLFLTVLLALISVSFFARETRFSNSLFMHLAVPLVSLAGGFIGKKRKTKYAHRRKRTRARR